MVESYMPGSWLHERAPGLGSNTNAVACMCRGPAGYVSAPPRSTMRPPAPTTACAPTRAPTSAGSGCVHVRQVLSSLW